MTEYGGVVQVSNSLLTDIDPGFDPMHPIGPVDPAMPIKHILRAAHDKFVDSGEIPPGEPEFRYGGRQQMYRDDPCPVDGAEHLDAEDEFQKCSHMDEDDEVWEWPHTSPTDKFTYLFGWYRDIEGEK